MKDRIVSAAIELLNELGPHKVTTNHIIDALGISPGTLYYHYRNREQIILSIFQRITEDFDALFIENPVSGEITGLLSMIEQIYRLYFKYRFFYMNLSMLLDRDPILAEAYRENYRIKRKKLEKLFSSLEKQGLIRPFESPEEKDIFLQNQWLINDYWLGFQKAVGISDAEEMIRKGIRGYLAFIREYLTPRGRSALVTRHNDTD
ncbi:TetR/AcrR family transcriptional regulator [Marispirochaeta aestuarii]|uniref:TetR/AcrR family transcriptional regulator n=1 Tax=Marispirochaeta aestuarii TaxID=1963862 RepID=UPI0029C72355|nr:TetR/AcrR family transcriptional regulator [Marispirochaeta aestuarii]